MSKSDVSKNQKPGQRGGTKKAQSTYVLTFGPDGNGVEQRARHDWEKSTQ